MECFHRRVQHDIVSSRWRERHRADVSSNHWILQVQLCVAQSAWRFQVWADDIKGRWHLTGGSNVNSFIISFEVAVWLAFNKQEQKYQARNRWLPKLMVLNTLLESNDPPYTSNTMQLLNLKPLYLNISMHNLLSDKMLVSLYDR